MAASGRHGRKTGRGWYAYEDGARHRPEDPEPRAVGGGDGLVVIAGDTVLASELFDGAAMAGWEVATPEDARGEVPFLGLDLAGEDDDLALQGGPQALLCDHSSLATLDGDGPAVGFHVLPPLDATQLVELTRGPGTSQTACDAAERFFSTLGKHV